MPQPKNGLINLINNQANRSDNYAPQDQCCFVVFMSFSGGLGLKCGLVSRLGCRGCGVMFYFFFVCTGLWACLIHCLVYTFQCSVESSAGVQCSVHAFSAFMK